jgi:RNA polymerase sigma-70 factor (ECF subfamily)
VDDADDAAVVARCLGGDVGAFETLVERYHALLFNVALRILGDREEAADATQNTFLKVYEHLGDYDSAHRFFSWTYRILRNDCLNSLRQRRQQEPVPVELPVEDIPVDAVDVRERRRMIQAALLALPVEQREVVVLRHFAEMSYEEMSVALRVPAKTVKSRLHAARGRLVQLLVDQRL